METKQKLDLSEFTGTFHYYKAGLLSNMNVTDGVHMLRIKGNCFWLTDIIASYQHELKGEDFQVWKLSVFPDKKALVSCEDGNDHILKTQELSYTDFEKQTGLTEIEIWVENNVMLLPSEH